MRSRYDPNNILDRGSTAFPGLDEITSDAQQNLVGQVSPASASSLMPNLGGALGAGLATSGLQGLTGLYAFFQERADKEKERKIRQEEFDRQLALQTRGQDFRESSYRNESPTRTAQAASGLNNVAGQNLKYLDLIRGLRGVGV
jgi:hypothetical protein